jgi:hypothetical protein
MFAREEANKIDYRRVAYINFGQSAVQLTMLWIFPHGAIFLSISSIPNRPLSANDSYFKGEYWRELQTRMYKKLINLNQKLREESITYMFTRSVGTILVR